MFRGVCSRVSMSPGRAGVGRLAIILASAKLRNAAQHVRHKNVEVPVAVDVGKGHGHLS